jgi:hypothetical protein
VVGNPFAYVVLGECNNIDHRVDAIICHEQDVGNTKIMLRLSDNPPDRVMEVTARLTDDSIGKIQEQCWLTPPMSPGSLNAAALAIGP